MTARGSSREHSCDYHIDPKPGPKRTTTKKKSNAASARGSGMKTKGGKGNERGHR